MRSQTAHSAEAVKNLSARFRGALVFAQLLLAPLAGAQAPPTAPKPIGSIVDSKEGHLRDGKVTVDYSYGTDSRLILVIRGVEMDGAAKSVGGELAVKGNQIQIAPQEVYGERGAMEATKFYSLRYIVPNVTPGTYRLLHDDSKAAGGGRPIDISLDLRKPVKKTLVITAKLVVAPPPASAPDAAPAPVIKDEP